LNPKVTIITVCYNSAKTIEDTIQSVVTQTYQNIEYIIVDGLSTDNTLDIVNTYKGKIATILSEKDEGLYDAINKGIELATGTILNILNSDDLYQDENVVADMVERFEKEQLDGCYADLVYVAQYDTSKVVRTWKSGAYKEGLFFKGWMPPHPTFFVKKEIYKQLGSFDLQFNSAADYELMLRFIHKNKIALGYLPRITVRMRMGGLSNASLKNRLKANNEDKKAWLINELKPKFYTLIFKPLSKIGQFLKKN
jgi:glycosyltransferase involved in cell wall biosynthesis